MQGERELFISFVAKIILHVLNLMFSFPRRVKTYWYDFENINLVFYSISAGCIC